MKGAVVLAAIIAVTAPQAARAADPCIGNLSSAQIVGCLNVAPKTRGFPTRTRGIGVEGEQAQAPASVNLLVNFDFNSASLTNDGMISLQALGQALADPSLRGARFRIAGHTDAVGSDTYNQKLSESRAHAVLDYLVAHYQVSAANFEVVGYGKTQLYDTADPTAASNRRVQVTRLTPAG
jgi:outer membrane protein OmpA-like peptidoglycan-associated protein